MKLSRISIYMVIILMMIIGVQPAMANVKDVPSDHWAHQAVLSLVNRGYLAVYEDGTFQGTRSVDRYTLASALARILDEIEAGRVSGYQGDAGILKDLTTELRAELVEWYASRDEMKSSISDTQKQMLTTEDRLNRVVASSSVLQEEVARIKADLMAEASRSAVALQKQEADLQASVANLEAKLRAQQDTIDKLENWTGEKGAVFAALESEGSNLQGQLDKLMETVAKTDGDMIRSIETLNRRNIELEKDLQNLAVKLHGDSTQLAELQSEFDIISSKVGISEEELAVLSRKISDDISLQMNATIIREQRLERELKELQAEFESYKKSSEKDIRSAKSSALIATVAATIGIIFGIVF